MFSSLNMDLITDFWAYYNAADCHVDRMAGNRYAPGCSGAEHADGGNHDSTGRSLHQCGKSIKKTKYNTPNEAGDG
jgi:hypothetical protein